jgi:hypothetical protein
MSAAFEAALGQLGLIERNDLATMPIAKVIIGLGGRTRRREAVCLSIEADINRDAQFAPKNGQKPKPSRWPQLIGRGRNHPPRRGSFFFGAAIDA